jgi:hypothetical protein
MKERSNDREADEEDEAFSGVLLGVLALLVLLMLVTFFIVHHFR